MKKLIIVLLLFLSSYTISYAENNYVPLISANQVSNSGLTNIELNTLSDSLRAGSFAYLDTTSNTLKPYLYNFSSTPTVGSAITSLPAITTLATVTSCYIGNNKALIVYKPTSYLTACVISNINASTSAGSPVNTSLTTGTFASVCYIGNNKAFVAFKASTTYISAYVISNLNTTPTWGSAITGFESVRADYVSSVYLGEDRVAVSYHNSTTGLRTIIISTVSSAPSISSAYNLATASGTSYMTSIYMGNGKIFITYRSGSSYIYGVIFNTLSFKYSTPFQISTGVSAVYPTACMIEDSKIFVAWRDTNLTNYGQLKYSIVSNIDKYSVGLPVVSPPINIGNCVISSPCLSSAYIGNDSVALQYLPGVNTIGRLFIINNVSSNPLVYMQNYNFARITSVYPLNLLYCGDGRLLVNLNRVVSGIHRTANKYTNDFDKYITLEDGYTGETVLSSKITTNSVLTLKTSFGNQNYGNVFYSTGFDDILKYNESFTVGNETININPFLSPSGSCFGPVVNRSGFASSSSEIYIY